MTPNLAANATIQWPTDVPPPIPNRLTRGSDVVFGRPVWIQHQDSVAPANRSENIDNLFERGVAWFEKGEYQAAADEFLKIVQRRPTFFHAQYNLAAAYFKRGHPREALRHINKALDLYTDDPRSLLLLGLIQTLLDDVDRAFRSLRRAQRGAIRDGGITDDELGEAFFILGRKYSELSLHKGDSDAWRYMEQAEAAYREAIKSQPALGESYFWSGILHQEMAYHVSDSKRQAYLRLAIDELSRALSLGALSSEACNDLAAMLQEIGELRSSEEMFEKSINLDPRNAVPLLNLARLLLQMERWDEVIEVCERGLAVTDHSRYRSEFLNDMGGALLSLKRFPEASSAIEQAIELDRTNEYAHANLGAVFVHEGRPRQAIPHFKDALKINPYNEATARNLGIAYLELAYDAIDRGAFEDAEPSLAKALAYGVAHPEALRMLGDTHLYYGRLAEAAGAYRRSLIKDPANQRALQGLEQIRASRPGLVGDDIVGELRRLERFDDSPVANSFGELASKWHGETGAFPSVRKRTRHSTYQSIIDLGEPVIPLLLRELMVSPDYWCEALEQLTGENLDLQHPSFDELVEGWLDWGRRRGYIH